MYIKWKKAIQNEKKNELLSIYDVSSLLFPHLLLKKLIFERV